MSRLRAEEEDVRREIELALEKENIERERGVTEESEVESSEEETQARSSASLRADLEEVQKKVDRFQKRRGLDDEPEVNHAKEAVVECYKRNPTTTLDCWYEVAQFKGSVAKAEQKFVDSLR